MILNWPRHLVCGYSNSFHWEEKEFWEELSGLLIWCSAGFVGEYQGILTNLWTESKWKKEEDHWTLVLEVKKGTENISIFLGLFQDEKDSKFTNSCFFNAIISPKKFQTLKHQISNSSSLEKELIKNRWKVRTEVSLSLGHSLFPPMISMYYRD